MGQTPSTKNVSNELYFRGVSPLQHVIAFSMACCFACVLAIALVLDYCPGLLLGSCPARSLWSDSISLSIYFAAVCMLNAINMWFKTRSCMPLLSLARCPSKHLDLSASLCNGMCKLCMAMSENIEGMPVQARYVEIGFWKVHARCAM